MSLLADMVGEAATKELRFLVIGGHAVNAHGFSRFTKDLDLLIPAATRPAWEELLQRRGFTVFRDEKAFLQFKAPPEFLWPLDLMLVNDRTFEILWGAALEVEWNSLRVRMPGLEGLFALKYHALQHGPARRHLKDLLDVLSLAEANGVDVRSDNHRQLCHKYGGPEVYERILAFSSGAT